MEQLFADYRFARGSQARIARELGVNRSTISLDIQKLWAPDDGTTYPTCARWMADKGWNRLQEDEAAIRRAVLSWQGGSSRA